jgi:hypothetical protein
MNVIIVKPKKQVVDPSQLRPQSSRAYTWLQWALFASAMDTTAQIKQLQARHLELLRYAASRLLTPAAVGSAAQVEFGS